MRTLKTFGGLAVAAGLVWTVAAAQRPRRQAVGESPAAAPSEPVAAPPAPQAHVHAGLRRRFATSLAFCLIFFAGAALAAGAGNELVSSSPAVDSGSTDPALTTDTLTTTTTDALTTTDAVTTTTDDVTTTDAATTTEPDPSDATPAPQPDTAEPVLAAPTLAVQAPAAAPARKPTHAVRRAQPRAIAAAPVVSPFPVVAFDPQAWLTDHPGSPLGNEAVALAEHYLGVPYRWGGNTPATGFDCSGLTQFVYAQLGIWLPHYAAAQFLEYPRLDPSDLEPGDLVFFEPKADGPGHVAIYAGNGEIVEAPHTGAVVRIGSLAGAAASLGYLGAVRPSQLAGAFEPAPARDVAGRFVAA